MDKLIILKKELEKLTINDIKPSTRKYPYINFEMDREAGNDILMVENLTKPGVFENVSFVVNKNDKIGIVSDKSTTISALFNIIIYFFFLIIYSYLRHM